MLVGGAADAGQFGHNEVCAGGHEAVDDGDALAVVEQVGVNVAALPVA